MGDIDQIISDLVVAFGLSRRSELCRKLGYKSNRAHTNWPREGIPARTLREIERLAYLEKRSLPPSYLAAYGHDRAA